MGYKNECAKKGDGPASQCANGRNCDKKVRKGVMCCLALLFFASAKCSGSPWSIVLVNLLLPDVALNSIILQLQAGKRIVLGTVVMPRHEPQAAL